jgi:hypothetical protein
VCWKIPGTTKLVPGGPERPGGPDVQRSIERPGGPDVHKSFEPGNPEVRKTEWGTIDGYSIRTAVCATMDGGLKLLVMYMNKPGSKGGVLNLTLLRLQDARLGGGRGRVY